MQTPRSSHLQAAYHTLRYLRSDPALGIFLNSDPSLQLLGFCDADWAACAYTWHSVNGFYLSLDGSPVSWKSKKQPVVSLSSAEAEPHFLELPTSSQIADLFTKALAGPLHRHFTGKLGVRSPDTYLRGDVSDGTMTVQHDKAFTEKGERRDKAFTEKEKRRGLGLKEKEKGRD
ncbi:secreted RxLR effector protein 161-like [Lycium barbarum]|uniref:secreted RxLR effector protein 161-like n=1 Tax=Lycium barbarum TaxID=112863 RepID=UPI00293E5F2D|nr:secreted RxLR effector protein 161-like [Lycium barbarum]